MEGRSSKAVSFHDVQNAHADRLFFIKDKFRQVQTFFSRAIRDLYEAFCTMLAFDDTDELQLKRIVWSTVSSMAAFIIGEAVTTRLSRTYFESDEYDFVFKFIFGSAILGYSALHRITDHRLKSPAQISAAVATEVMAIIYLYTSTFRGSRMLLEGHLSDNYSLIASLGASGFVVPGTISYLAKKIQEKLIQRQANQGAQRSDTAIISSGRTPISSNYFLTNYFLVKEISTASHAFQLVLIGDNVLMANKWVEKFRNVPALCASAGPKIKQKWMQQKDNINNDFKHNTTMHRVLRFTNNGSEFHFVPRYKLRTDDLVYCGHEMDLSSMPISGEIVALARDKYDLFTSKLIEEKASVNLERKNGESNWIEYKTSTKPSEDNQVDLHAIHAGKKAAVLVGSKLNVYGGDNFFIRVKKEKELTVIRNEEKKSIIEDIIENHKRKGVFYSILSSIAMAGLLHRNMATLPAYSARLLFDLFQILLPFAENFLREMVNGKLMKKLNENLKDDPLETIDALRIVDLCNALSGYYRDRFSRGVTIVTDKTGTLTTQKMNVLGFWTTEMNPAVQELIHEEKGYLLPSYDKQIACFDVFASAYTNNSKEIEPEEFGILQLFKSAFKNEDILKIDTLGNNQFRKTLHTKELDKTIKTYHLGLYRQLGGRLTLVEEEKEHYLVFCGIPRGDKFSGTSLLQSYATAKPRQGVLSRDWCVARAQIDSNQFDDLKTLFYSDDKQEIEKYVIAHFLDKFNYYCTFIIDNPVKKSAEKFISQCRDINVPVYIATGDTAKSAENIAKILCPKHSDQIFTIRAADVDTWRDKVVPRDATVIFAGINDEILSLFDRLTKNMIHCCPVVIFAEMSTESKGVLAQYLKKNGYFVVVNGDGTNDVAMMRSAHVVFAHLTEEGTYAPGVGQFANLNDRQMQRLLQSNGSFYESFDIHLANSQFMQQFIRLANTQEKPSIALLLKSSKMSFELAAAVGAEVKPMWQQHWFTVGFDLMWLWISFNEINNSADLPVDSRHLGVSDFPGRCMLTTFAIAALQSLVTYVTSGESTNVTWMLLMLGFLPLVLKSIFSSYGHVRDERDAVNANVIAISEEKKDFSDGRDPGMPRLTCQI